MPRDPNAPDSPALAKPPAWLGAACRHFWRLILLLLALVAGFVGVALGYYYHEAEGRDITRVGKMPERSIVYDWKKREIGRLHGENRSLVEKSDVSTYFVDALLAREDSRFYDHGGIDWRGVARSILRNLKDREMTQGASTLTMQLARCSFDIREKTLHRKLLEAMLAWRIERNYQKNEILIHYMNRIYFGAGVYGVELASQAYFGKPAREMDLGEAAMLAGIIRGPNRFSPFRHYAEAERERNTVLDRMLLHGFVTAPEVTAAKAAKVNVMDPLHIAAPPVSYAMEVVRRDLELILAQQDTEEGGLRIITALDIDLQRAAEQSLETRLAEVEQKPGYAHQTRAAYLARKQGGEEAPPQYLQGAVVVIDNASGGLRAIVGGRSFQESQFNRATMSQRQIGSLFKPFVYAKAYENGLLPGTLVNDGPIRPGEIAWARGGTWSPENSDNTFGGLLPAEIGLVKSRNTMSVRVGEIAGIEPIGNLARQAGFTVPAERSPQIYIGNLGATVQAVTSAYSAFANEGAWMRSHVITSVVDQNGNQVYRQITPRVRILSPAVTWLTTRTLEKVMEPGGTAWAARSQGLKAPAGGKTGTTNNYNDAWFVGFTGELSCGVWVGLDQQKTIIDRGYGATLALPVWTDVMIFAENNGYEPKPLFSNVNLTRIEVCRSSGKLATGNCRAGKNAYPLDLPVELVPRDACRAHGFLGPARSGDAEGRGFIGRIRGLFH
ncbi:MAG: transglycosylase domain-containing protein [Verrucomicrobia bacterium]|nr:transglycosylase domain-containing protein [Verrucomicrobiota bacterium]